MLLSILALFTALYPYGAVRSQEKTDYHALNSGLNTARRLYASRQSYAVDEWVNSLNDDQLDYYMGVLQDIDDYGFGAYYHDDYAQYDMKGRGWGRSPRRPSGKPSRRKDRRKNPRGKPSGKHSTPSRRPSGPSSDSWERNTKQAAKWVADQVASSVINNVITQAMTPTVLNVMHADDREEFEKELKEQTAKWGAEWISAAKKTPKDAEYKKIAAVEADKKAKTIGFHKGGDTWKAQYKEEYDDLWKLAVEHAIKTDPELKKKVKAWTDKWMKAYNFKK